MKTRRMRRALQTGLAALVALVGSGAQAVEQWKPTQFEMAMLPAYCSVRFNSPNNSPEYKKWQGILGPDFLHVHHFCAGLNFLARSYKTHNKPDRDYNLQNALTNFSVTIKAMSPTTRVVPEAYLDRGITYSLQKNYVQAIPDISKALQLNPRLIRGYNALATIYVNNNQKGQALEIVTMGLRNNPEAKSLQTRYTELGGKLPYPEPVNPTQADAPRTDSAQVPESATKGQDLPGTGEDAKSN